MPYKKVTRLIAYLQSFFKIEILLLLCVIVILVAVSLSGMSSFTK